MNIALDASPLLSGHSFRGVGGYTKLLIEALQKYENKHSYLFFTQGQKVPKSADLVHYPYFDPFFLTLPLIQTKPTVVTVHDLIPIVFPERFSRGIRGEIKWRIQRQSLRWVNAVITDSIASKRDLIKFTGLGQDKIDTVYLAPAKIFQPVVNEDILKKVKEKYGLPETFLLYVGDVNWNKNLPRLLEAYALLSLPNIKLVLVGKVFGDEALKEIQAINNLIDTLGIRQSVLKPGFVAEGDLPAIYSLASVYVQPSLAEGFGLPVLEAMACGCPVVTSRLSSLEEIAGPAVLANPYQFGDIVRAIKEVLSLMASQRWKLIQDGLAWVKNFSWEKTAKQTLKVYEKVLARD